MWKEIVIEKEIKKGDYLYALVREHPNATKNGYVLYHRVVAENKIKRFLRDDDVVHHIDGNRYNNSPENLEVMSRKDHEKLHGQEIIKNRPSIPCANCGKILIRQKSRMPQALGRKNAFCSRECSGKYNGFKKK